MERARRLRQGRIRARHCGGDSDAAGSIRDWRCAMKAKSRNSIADVRAQRRRTTVVVEPIDVALIPLLYAMPQRFRNALRVLVLGAAVWQQKRLRLTDDVVRRALAEAHRAGIALPRETPRRLLSGVKRGIAKRARVRGSAPAIR